MLLRSLQEDRTVAATATMHMATRRGMAMLGGVAGRHGPVRPALPPMLAENDNGEALADARSLAAMRDALRPLLRRHGAGLLTITAAEMQAAFWRGDMAAYRRLFARQTMLNCAIALLPVRLAR